jgi:hypothetical protein
MLSYFATVLSHFATVLSHFATVQCHFVISYVIFRILLRHSFNFAQSFLGFVYNARSVFDFLNHFVISPVILSICL